MAWSGPSPSPNPFTPGLVGVAFSPIRSENNNGPHGAADPLNPLTVVSRAGNSATITSPLVHVLAIFRKEPGRHRSPECR